MQKGILLTFRSSCHPWFRLSAQFLPQQVIFIKTCTGFKNSGGKLGLLNLHSLDSEGENKTKRDYMLESQFTKKPRIFLPHWMGGIAMDQVRGLDKPCLRLRFWQQLYFGDLYLKYSGLKVFRNGKSGLLWVIYWIDRRLPEKKSP